MFVDLLEASSPASMKTLLLIPVACLALFSNACRTAYPLCPVTMKPTTCPCTPSQYCQCEKCVHCHGSHTVIHPAK